MEWFPLFHNFLFAFNYIKKFNDRAKKKVDYVQTITSSDRRILRSRYLNFSGKACFLDPSQRYQFSRLITLVTIFCVNL